ncbi:MAG: hypothetical protein QM758_04120 [Armatimonas sp.]
MKKTLAVAMATLTLMPCAFAQNVIQKHPTATGVVAGVATHAALKRSAAAKKRQHRKLNFAERHPTLTGIAAGVATTKIIKHTTSHRSAHPVAHKVTHK